MTVLLLQQVQYSLQTLRASDRRDGNTLHRCTEKQTSLISWEWDREKYTSFRPIDVTSSSLIPQTGNQKISAAIAALLCSESTTYIFFFWQQVKFLLKNANWVYISPERTFLQGIKRSDSKLKPGALSYCFQQLGWSCECWPSLSLGREKCQSPGFKASCQAPKLVLWAHLVAGCSCGSWLTDYMCRVLNTLQHPKQ